MPDDASLDPPVSSACDEVHVGYVPVPSLDRLMGLRDALVALNGPLASEPELRESLQRRFLNEDVHNRVLGKICCSLSG
ncbi:hypothetical protein [Pseudomonas sp. CHM02]|uniref:hypothetical protein n=1 Tax=Pseudomonas sp. CHM02 TaxID=1463662 RepID=UPI00352944DC